MTARRPSLGQGGFSLIEVLVSSLLIGVISFSAFYFFTFSFQQMKNAENVAGKQSLTDSFERMLMVTIQSVNPANFMPTQTRILSPTSIMGVTEGPPRWVLNGRNVPPLPAPGPAPSPPPPPAPIPGFFTFGGKTFVQNSSTVELFRIRRLPMNGPLIKETTGVLFSRCVNARTFNGISDVDDLMTLATPVLRAGDSSNPAAYMCCQIAMPPPGGSLPPTTSACTELNDLEHWPTVFLYTGPGKPIQQWPTKEERSLVPGLGFMISMDSASPITYSLRMLRMTNRCKATMINKTGECARTVENFQNMNHFARDIRIEVKETIKPVVNELTGSSFISLGTVVGP